MADWVELRVHGVSGTPPENMLASAQVKQVAGDDRSRSFRPTDAQGNEVLGSEGQVLEAFHWGRWTSGSWTQALWILLIPFGIVNAGQFMLPAPESRAARVWHALCGAMLRLLAMALTMLFAVASSVVVMDLVGWQWLAPMDLPGDDRVVVVPSVVVAVALVYLISLLGRLRAGRRRYGLAAEPAGLPGLGDTAFFDGDPDNPSLRHLHLAGASFLIAWLALSVAARADASVAGGRWAALAGLGLTVLVLLVLGDPERSTTVSAGTGRVRQWWHGWSSEGRVITDDPPSEQVARALHRLALAAALGGAVAIAFAPVTDDGALRGGSPRLPGMEFAAAGAGIGGAVALVLLGLALLGLALTTRTAAAEVPAPFRRFAGGMTAWLAAALGFFLGIGLTAGLALTVQGLVNRLQRPGRAVQAPDVLQRASFTWGVAAGLTIPLALLAVWWLRHRRARFVTAAAAAYTFGTTPPENERPRLPGEWLRRVGHAMQRARLKNQLELVFWIFAVIGTVLAAAAAIDHVVEAVTQRASVGVIDWFTGTSSAPGQPVGGDDIVIGIGQFALLGLAGGAVLMARGAIRAEGPRRALNVIWDVVAFWPRSVHPFVPPPYAQEVVPGLVRRICWHLGHPDPFPDAAPRSPADLDGEPPASAAAVPRTAARTVVLAAHSQGSLISLAALLQLPPPLRPRVVWLTFGSQLCQQFPRAFPHYVTVPDLRAVAVRYNWLSLYRDTDPIAGPVTSWNHTATVDGRPASCRLLGPAVPVADDIDPTTGRRECGREWRLLDPPASDWRFQTSAVAVIQGHSNYWLDRNWDDAVRAVRARRAPAVEVPAARPEPPPRDSAGQTVST